MNFKIKHTPEGYSFVKIKNDASPDKYHILWINIPVNDEIDLSKVENAMITKTPEGGYVLHSQDNSYVYFRSIDSNYGEYATINKAYGGNIILQGKMYRHKKNRKKEKAWALINSLAPDNETVKIEN